ncbi:MAG: DUF1272 domain-containing protein [Pyrinomonadaceae bacterium]|nr:DUF1272 domain-containing protein [Pyrinomonadaceae bacterium]
MALEMKSSCEGCDVILSADGKAFICSYECTFCSEYARHASSRHPDCGGESVRRPTRKTTVAES